MCGIAGELSFDGAGRHRRRRPHGRRAGAPRPRRPGAWSAGAHRPGASPAGDHRPLRAWRPADGRLRARAGGRLQRLHLQPPRAAPRSSRPPGYRFFSDSDTEVVLKAYRHWGDALVDRLDGMFAFAIAERDTGRLVLARDRLGVKPLYLADDRRGAALRLHPPGAGRRRRRRHRIDRVALHHYLSSTPSCPRRARSWPACASCRPPPCSPSSRTAAAEQRVLGPAVRAATRGRADWTPRTGRTRCSRPLRVAVDRRMVADVPVGVLLSGGLDSSLIVALLARGRTARPGDVQHRLPRRGRRGGRRVRATPTWWPSASRPTTTRSGSTTIALLAGAPRGGGRDERADGQPRRASPSTCSPRRSRSTSRSCSRGQGADEIFAGYHWYQPLAGAPTGTASRLRRVFFDRTHDALVDPLSTRRRRLDQRRQPGFVAEHFARPGADDPAGSGAAPRHPR